MSNDCICILTFSSTSNLYGDILIRVNPPFALLPLLGQNIQRCNTLFTIIV